MVCVVELFVRFVCVVLLKFAVKRLLCDVLCNVVLPFFFSGVVVVIVCAFYEWIRAVCW